MHLCPSSWPQELVRSQLQLHWGCNPPSFRQQRFRWQLSDEWDKMVFLNVALHLPMYHQGYQSEPFHVDVWRSLNFEAPLTQPIMHLCWRSCKCSARRYTNLFKGCTIINGPCWSFHSLLCMFFVARIIFSGQSVPLNMLTMAASVRSQFSLLPSMLSNLSILCTLVFILIAEFQSFCGLWTIPKVTSCFLLPCAGVAQPWPSCHFHLLPMRPGGSWAQPQVQDLEQAYCSIM